MTHFNSVYTNEHTYTQLLNATHLQVADEDSPVSAFLNMTTSRQTGDLILIPQTQVGPVCEKCCEGCALCPPVRKQATRVQSKN